MKLSVSLFPIFLRLRYIFDALQPRILKSLLFVNYASTTQLSWNFFQLFSNLWRKYHSFRYTISLFVTIWLNFGIHSMRLDGYLKIKTLILTRTKWRAIFETWLDLYSNKYLNQTTTGFWQDFLDCKGNIRRGKLWEVKSRAVIYFV